MIDANIEKNTITKVNSKVCYRNLGLLEATSIKIGCETYKKLTQRNLHFIGQKKAWFWDFVSKCIQQIFQPPI